MNGKMAAYQGPIQAQYAENPRKMRKLSTWLKNVTLLAAKG